MTHFRVTLNEADTKCSCPCRKTWKLAGGGEDKLKAFSECDCADVNLSGLLDASVPADYGGLDALARMNIPAPAGNRILAMVHSN